MRRFIIGTALMLLASLPSFSQKLIGNYHQEYFSGKSSNDPGIYTVVTPAHKKGAVLIRMHAATVIERIYLVIDSQDVPRFVSSLERARARYAANETDGYDFFPPVSIMWRDRHRHIWIESYAVSFCPRVEEYDGRKYLSFVGNAKNNFLTDLNSGLYFMMLRDSKEIDQIIRILKSDVVRTSIQNLKMTHRPFEEVKDY